MKYDDASWHYESTPAGSKTDRWAVAAAHIGIYLKWCMERGWAGEIHTNSEASGILELLLAGKLTGSEFLLQECDGKFTDEDLNAEGNRFTASYFENQYADDLESVVGNAILSLHEKKYDYPSIKRLLDQRYTEWLSSSGSSG